MKTVLVMKIVLVTALTKKMETYKKKLRFTFLLFDVLKSFVIHKADNVVIGVCELKLCSSVMYGY